MIEPSTYQTIYPPCTAHPAKKCSQQEQTSKSTLSGVNLDRVDALKRRDAALKGQHVVETSEAKIQKKHTYDIPKCSWLFLDLVCTNKKLYYVDIIQHHAL